jgi:hypothetical protein
MGHRLPSLSSTPEKHKGESYLAFEIPFHGKMAPDDPIL